MVDELGRVLRNLLAFQIDRRSHRHQLIAAQLHVDDIRDRTAASRQRRYRSLLPSGFTDRSSVTMSMSTLEYCSWKRVKIGPRNIEVTVGGARMRTHPSTRWLPASC